MEKLADTDIQRLRDKDSTMKRITIPIIAVGLLILAACYSPVTESPAESITNGLPAGRFTPPSWLHGTWRFYTDVTVGSGRNPEFIIFTPTNVFIRPLASSRLQDLSTAWQDWTIKEAGNLKGYGANGSDRQGIKAKIAANYTATTVSYLTVTIESYEGSPRARTSQTSGTYVREAG